MIQQAMQAIDATHVREIMPTRRIIVQAPLLKGKNGYEPKKMALFFLSTICRLKGDYMGYEWVLQAQIDLSKGKKENGLLAVYSAETIDNLPCGELDNIDPEAIADTWNIRAKAINLISQDER